MIRHWNKPKVAAHPPLVHGIAMNHRRRHPAVAGHGLPACCERTCSQRRDSSPGADLPPQPAKISGAFPRPRPHVRSLKVLQRAGFAIIDTEISFANGRNAEIEETILRLDEPAKTAPSDVSGGEWQTY